MAVAKSPGSMVTAEKITRETTNKVTRPSASRCKTVRMTGFTLRRSVAVSALHLPVRAGSAREQRRGWAIGSPVARPVSRRSGEPPALGDLHAVALPVRRDVAMGKLLRVGFDVVVEDDDDLAAIVMDELLHLGVHAGPF